MDISRQQIEQIARLARLRLEPREIDALAGELATILDHTRELQAVETEGLPPMGGVSEQPAPFRDDEIGADPLERQLAELAPAFEEGFFVVPRLAALDADVLEGGSA